MRMSRDTIGTLAIVMLFVAIAFLIFIGTGIKSATKLMEAEVNNNIEATTASYSHDVSMKFGQMMDKTNDLASIIKTDFSTEEYAASPDSYIADYSESHSDVIKEFLSQSKDISGLYVMFDDKNTKDPVEVWYTRKGGKVERTYANLDRMKEERELKNKDTAYFFNTLKNEEGVWTGLYYDGNLDQDVFSFTRSVYVDGQFIAVIGADITQRDSVGMLDNKEKYPEGHVAIFDENGKYVIKQEKIGYDEGIALNKAYIKARTSDPKNSNGVFSLDTKTGERISGYSTLDNGWSFVFSKSEKSAYQSVYKIQRMVVFIGAALLFVVIVLMFSFLSLLVSKSQRQQKAENQKKEEE